MSPQCCRKNRFRRDNNSLSPFIITNNDQLSFNNRICFVLFVFFINFIRQLILERYFNRLLALIVNCCGVIGDLNIQDDKKEHICI